MNRLRKGPAYAGARGLLDLGCTNRWIFFPEPPLLYPRRRKATEGEKKRTREEAVQRGMSVPFARQQGPPPHTL
jgi:hypothetical protein